MNQNTALALGLILLLLGGAKGSPLSRKVRCTCIKVTDGAVNPRALEKLEIIPASQSCRKVEIIATMKKSGEKRCLNPESKAIKNLLKAVRKDRSKRSS